MPKMNRKGTRNDYAQRHRYAADRDDTDDIEEGGGPDDGEADRHFIDGDLWYEVRSVADEQDRIDGEIAKGVEPGPPAFEEGPADTQGTFDPLVVSAGDRHEAVQFEHCEDSRYVPEKGRDEQQQQGTMAAYIIKQGFKTVRPARDGKEDDRDELECAEFAA